MKNVAKCASLRKPAWAGLEVTLASFVRGFWVMAMP